MQEPPHTKSVFAGLPQTAAALVIPMKKFRMTEKRAVLITIAAGLMMIAPILIYNALTHARYSSADFYADYVRKYEAELTESARQVLAHGSAPDPLPSCLDKGNIFSILAEDGRVSFAIDFAYAPLEGHLYLCYYPGGDYVFPYDNPEWIAVTTDEKNRLRWERDMLGRVSWVEATRLSDVFFLERAFLPT